MIEKLQAPHAYMSTLSHLDFLFCLPSLVAVSTAGGTGSRPVAAADETPAKWLNIRTDQYPHENGVKKGNIFQPWTCISVWWWAQVQLVFEKKSNEQS